jgi:hypothetical protein
MKVTCRMHARSYDVAMHPSVDTITVADEPGRWRDVGFDVDEHGRCTIGTVMVRLMPGQLPRGIAGWSVRGLESADLDGLPTELSDGPAREPAPTHPNGVVKIDHLVAFTPDRARTVGALEAGGLEVRRLRDEPTPAGGGYQAFFRLGEVILEVIEQQGTARHPSDGAARFWGLALGVESLDATAEQLGDRLSDQRDAVQPGRRIATLRRSAEVAVPIAFMS